MEKYIWIRLDHELMPAPYVVLECSDQVAKKIERLDKHWNHWNRWNFLADLLHKKYPDQFPSWFDRYKQINLFWGCYNDIEDYNQVYKRMTKERMEHLKDKFKDKDDLRCEAEWQVWEVLESLPVFVL